MTLPFRSCRNPASSLYVDLDPLDYVEEEHVVRGSGWVTRVLVRRPADDWSGTVVIEPFHVLDEDTVGWTTSWRHLTRRRHAWVGVTVGTGTWAPRGGRPSGGVTRLQREDPDRYRELRLSDPPGTDDFARMGRPSAEAHDVLADVARRLRHDGDWLGVPARRIYGSGWSQTGLVWSHYLDAGHPVEDLDAVWVAVAPPPSSIRPVTVVHLVSECELLGLLSDPIRALPDRDDPMMRGYEVPGTFHYWEQKVHRGDRAHADQHDDRPWSVVVHALFDHLDRWTEDGIPLPRADRVDGRDALSNALGGIRSPWLDVPDGTYLAGCSCSPATGAVVPVDVVAHYGSMEAYRQGFAARVETLVADGWLLAEDARTLVPPC